MWYTIVPQFPYSGNQDMNLVFTPNSKYLLSIANSELYVNFWDLATKSLYSKIEEENTLTALMVLRRYSFI